MLKEKDYLLIASVIFIVFVTLMFFYIQANKKASSEELSLYQDGMICKNEMFDLYKLKINCNTGLTGETIFSFQGHSTTKFNNGINCKTQKIKYGYFKTECSNGVLGEINKINNTEYIVNFSDGIMCKISRNSPFNSITTCRRN